MLLGEMAETLYLALAAAQEPHVSRVDVVDLERQLQGKEVVLDSVTDKDWAVL